MKQVKTLKVFSLVFFFVALYLPLYKATIFAFGISGSVSINITNLGLSTIMQVTMFVTVLFGIFGNFVRLSLQKIADIVVVVLFTIQLLLIVIAKDSAVNYGLGFLTMIVTLAIYTVSSFLPAFALKAYDAARSVFQSMSGKLVDAFGDSGDPTPAAEPLFEPEFEPEVAPEEPEKE